MPYHPSSRPLVAKFLLHVGRSPPQEWVEARVSPVAERARGMTLMTPRVTDARVISIQGRIEAAKIIELERQLAGPLRVGRIVLDLSAATGVPPRTLSLLRGALRRALHSGSSLAIVGANQPVRSAIESCALDRVEFHRTASTALSGQALEPVRFRATRLAAPDTRPHTAGG